jgi:hypothetical protein
MTNGLGETDDGLCRGGPQVRVGACSRRSRTSHQFARDKASNYLVRRRWDYFVNYFLDVTPPKDFEIRPEK